MQKYLQSYSSFKNINILFVALKKLMTIYFFQNFNQWKENISCKKEINIYHCITKYVWLLSQIIFVFCVKEQYNV